MAADRTFQTRDPVIRVEDATWSRIVDVDGLGLRRVLSFPRAVTWLRSSLSKAVLVNASGRIVDDGSTYCDVSSLLQSLSSAQESALEMARENAVGSGPFAVKVLVDVTDTPALPLPRERWDTDATPPRWARAPDDWFTAEDPAALDAWLAGPAPRDHDARPETVPLRPVAVLQGHVAWDSRWDAHRRRSELATLLELAFDGLPAAVADQAAARLREELRELAEA